MKEEENEWGTVADGNHATGVMATAQRPLGSYPRCRRWEAIISLDPLNNSPAPCPEIRFFNPTGGRAGGNNVWCGINVASTCQTRRGEIRRPFWPWTPAEPTNAILARQAQDGGSGLVAAIPSNDCGVSVSNRYGAQNKVHYSEYPVLRAMYEVPTHDILIHVVQRDCNRPRVRVRKPRLRKELSKRDCAAEIGSPGPIPKSFNRPWGNRQSSNS
ncbi:uncharacterized protein BP5553_01642 [Venustampulla echinocandica]|uniref:Uncharacterized protein n=1 Tax=Venustampulla echinocandica TaxID=2656787 RepID=A0A370U1P0_9HELO|nr:uncharacterized protein BP5553_01642 [Venustampulla echinocandica]RDL41663.1 hypothetical protein BP5553_01642 [Venustampulla echinocandica]